VEASDSVDPAGPGVNSASFHCEPCVDHVDPGVYLAKFDCEPCADLVGSRSAHVLLVKLQDLRSAESFQPLGLPLPSELLGWGMLRMSKAITASSAGCVGRRGSVASPAFAACLVASSFISSAQSRRRGAMSTVSLFWSSISDDVSVTFNLGMGWSSLVWRNVRIVKDRSGMGDENKSW
jgi:hypothetical protein